MIIKKLKRFTIGKLYKAINSEYYDKFRPNENSKFYVKSNLKSVGENFNLPDQFIVKNPQYISIGDNFKSLYNLRLECWDKYYEQNFEPNIFIGNNVILNSDCHIGCINKVTIGDGVLMASRVYISDHFHGEPDISTSQRPSRRDLVSKGPVIIENNVWIGQGVCVMPNVTIGANSIIGANSVVTKSVPSNVIIGGCPAKIIKRIKHGEY